MDELKLLQSRLANLVSVLDIDSKQKRLEQLQTESVEPDFWKDQEKARKIMQEIGSLKEEIGLFTDVKKALDDASSVASEPELHDELVKTVRDIKKKLDSLETATLLSGKFDKDDAVLAIHAGQGGTEAMDWTNMLFRMYLRFAEQKGWDIEVVEQLPGEEAGLKSVTILIKGAFAYGLLKGEAGTHRLVRLSPFNADNLRQTSFALVEVLPKIEETPELIIKDDDLDWQFFRSSSQGGQNVQKVSTAVRLIHKPTGITVTAQSQRFQEQNRQIALDLLRSKLWARREAEEKETVKKIKGEYRPAAWGTQIRSYILHPYKMVKDLRTGVETSDPQKVLDGEIDEFIDGELRMIKKETSVVDSK